MGEILRLIFNVECRCLLILLLYIYRIFIYLFHSSYNKQQSLRGWARGAQFQQFQLRLPRISRSPLVANTQLQRGQPSAFPWRQQQFRLIWLTTVLVGEIKISFRLPNVKGFLWDSRGSQHPFWEITPITSTFKL